MASTVVIVIGVGTGGLRLALYRRAICTADLAGAKPAPDRVLGPGNNGGSQA